ncbi:MAG: hypothetical protein IV100_18910 [Myxococcales bacterium]|nr:hypothetical protein [Myxococcales bacterium]
MASLDPKQRELTAQVLDDYRRAPISEGLRSTLAFLERMTLAPDALTPDDARAVLAAGVSKAALEDAIEVAYLFNIYDRLADSMGWHVPEEGSRFYEGAAAMLLKRGYG